MKFHSLEYSRRIRYQTGFSLIELMIAITLGLLILAGMLTVFVNTSAARNEIERMNRQIENGRYATELLRDDIQLAGYYGEADMAKLRVTPGPPALMPDPCATSLTESTIGGTIGALVVHVQGADNYVAGGLSCLGAGVIKPGTDVIVVRRAKTCIAPPYVVPAGYASVWKLCPAEEVVANNKIYLQVPLCSVLAPVSGSLITTHALAVYPNAGEFVHRVNGADCSTTAAAPMRPYVNYMYFVGTDNVLKRAEFVNGVGMGNVTSLVDGIENLQIEYGVDTTDIVLSPPDGNANTYLSAAAIALVAPMPVPEVWSNVVTVKFHLLARNTETSPGTEVASNGRTYYKDTKTYNLGSSVAFTPNSSTIVGPNGEPETAYRRHVYSSLVRITNVSGSREKP